MNMSVDQNLANHPSYNPCPLHRIFIRELVMFASIGVHHHKTLATQRIRVSVEVLANLNRYLKDDLKSTVCYDEIVGKIRRMASQGHVQLVETFADQVITACFVDSRVEEVVVTVEKLDIYEDVASVGVTMSASRQSTLPVSNWAPIPAESRARDGSAIRAYLIDMDGTLLDTESIDRAATIAAIERLGYADVSDIYDSLVGLAANKWEPILKARYGIDFYLDEFHAAYSERREVLLKDGVNLRPGVVEFLEALQATGRPISIVTSSSRKTAMRLLKLTGIYRYFDLITTRDDVENSKPAPDLYLLAVKKLGLSPELCIAVEDSAPGVEAAHAAGVKVYMVPDILQPDSRTRELCAAVVSDLEGVLLHLKITATQPDDAKKIWP